MDVVRITELQPKTYVEQGDYIAIDNQSDGTKKVQFTNLLDDTLSQENKIAPANVVGDEIATIKAAVGSPLKASTVAQMTDTNKIYVYVGSESGYTNGNWYYWNGSAWTSGGVYNSVAVVTDPTLTLSGVPADAKATGDEVTDLKSDLSEVQDLMNPQSVTETIVTADSGVTWESGYFYNGEIGSTITKTAYNTLSCAYYGTVKKGDILTVNARKAGTGYALYLTDVNDKVLDYCDTISGNYYNNQAYTVPKDGKLYLNTYTADYLTGVKAYLLTKTTTLYTSINDVIDMVDDVYDMFNTVEITTRVVTADSGATWESGYFYNGEIGGAIVKTAYANLSCAIYGAVNKGEKYTVNARKAGTGYAIYLTDANGVILDYCDTISGNYYNAQEYTVPQDGIMYLNTFTADYLTGAKAYFLDKTVTSYESEKSVLNGVKWASIGDSIVEFNRTAEQNWVKDLIATTGIVNTNLAIGGTGFYRAYDSSQNYISRITLIPSDTELITVCGSFNDLSSSPLPELPVGTASDTGTATLAGYMNDFFDALITAFPTTPIAVMMTNPWQSYRPSVTRSDDYVSVLKAICEKNGIPFYGDCYFGCNLKPWNASNKTEYFTHSDGTVDGTHPNSKGHLFIYRMIKPFMEKVINKLM